MVSLYPKKDKIIKVLIFFFVLTRLNGQIFPYLLPDQKDDFDHILITQIKKSHHTIDIVTPKLHYPSLRHPLLHALTKGITLTLITQQAVDDPLKLIAYRGVNWNLYTPRSLGDTMIVMDDALVCHIAGGLDEERLSQKRSMVWCSDDPHLLQMMHSYVHHIQKKAHPYLVAP